MIGYVAGALFKTFRNVFGQDIVKKIVRCFSLCLCNEQALLQCDIPDKPHIMSLAVAAPQL
jgi:hypothetical protein